MEKLIEKKEERRSKGKGKGRKEKFAKTKRFYDLNVNFTGPESGYRSDYNLKEILSDC